jgi:hypothetical protein
MTPAWAFEIGDQVQFRSEARVPGPPARLLVVDLVDGDNIIVATRCSNGAVLEISVQTKNLEHASDLDHA